MSYGIWKQTKIYRGATFVMIADHITSDTLKGVFMIEIVCFLFLSYLNIFYDD